MNTYLWKIDKNRLRKTNLFLYSNFVKKNFNIDVNGDFNKLWEWSVNNPKIFWKSIWDFTQVTGNLGNILIKESNIFYKNRFFPNGKLNYAQNLLKKKQSRNCNNI